MAKQSRRETNDPSPDQILRETAAIRSRWSDHERSRRTNERPVSWMPPVFPAANLAFEEVERF